MELKDIVLNKGDIVYFKDGTFISMDIFDGSKATIFKNISKIERPIKYKTIYEEPKEILDKEEKEYLENVIRPFRDRVEDIRKVGNGYEWIRIELDKDTLCLPYFKEGKMYKGMKIDKAYTLKELGLFKGE